MARKLLIKSPGPDFTQDLGRTIGESASAGDVFLLTGPLGGGKTCLTQGIALGLGVEGQVRSPTFVLMTQHQGRLTLHHVDLYRIEGPAEAWVLGLEEQLFGEGVCVIEWADRAPEIFTEDCLWIDLEYGEGPDQRIITVERGATSRHFRYRRLMALLTKITTSGK